jgi:phage terminase small subunit
LKNSIPRHIEKTGRAWLKSLDQEFNFSPIEWKTALLAAEALDLIEQCGEQIRKDGLTTVDRFGQVKSHPLLTAVRDQKSVFRGLLKHLGLDNAEEQPTAKRHASQLIPISRGLKSGYKGE